MRNVAVIGAGPAGLMAAERLAGSGHRVDVYERMPSPARKFLLAGRGGLNLTHSEPLERFLGRYGGDAAACARIGAAVRAFPPEALVAWVEGLGQEVFTGSSGRVFPKAMKASPLLRAWLRRLEGLGVRLHTRHAWRGWGENGTLHFAGPDGGEVRVAADATLLALGGASWPRLGSMGDWLTDVAARGVACRPFAPSNCGVEIPWSEPMLRFAGQPLKRIAIACGGMSVRGEAMITARGLEGGAVYALSQPIRAELAASGRARLTLDLRPDDTVDDLTRRLQAPRGKRSTSTFLARAASLPPVAIAVLREASPQAALPGAPAALARLIKSVPLDVGALSGLERAISSVGGVALEAVDAHWMLTARPGVFVAGEMLDWDAPTGGYLLQATLATAVAAARGLSAWLDASRPAEAV